MQLKEKAILSDMTFNLLKHDGTETTHTGAWLIVDGGYHKWRVLQPPKNCAWREEEVFFSCRLESAAT
jgi:hypothetical protein